MIAKHRPVSTHRLPRAKWGVVGVIFSCPLWSTASAQPAPTIDDLGVLSGRTESEAWGVSDNGDVVTGFSYNRPYEDVRAWRWTTATGIVSLGFLPGREFSTGMAVSGDGTTIVGTSSDPSYAHPHPFRWTESEGMTDLGVLSPPDGYSYAFDVNQDGSIVVGEGSTIDAMFGNSPRAVRWAVGGEIRDLGVLPPAGPFASSGARAVSANGLVVAGGYGGRDFNWWAHPFRWTSDGGMVDLGLPPGAYHADTRGISADGSTIVGGLFTTEGERAFRWTAATGVNVIAGSRYGYARALAASGDGSVIVGAVEETAFLWTPELGRIPLRDYLASLGTDVSHWRRLVAANRITRDGTAVVGWGYPPGPDERRPFLIRGLPTRRCDADFNADGFVDFFDYSDFVTAFEAGDLAADANGDGFLDFFDYTDFVTAFETGC